MATAVQIQISVDPTDSAAKVGQVKSELDSLGSAGVSAGAKAGEGMQVMNGHFQTNLDSVRLLSQEFGFRMPRAIESMLSRIPAVTSALNGMIGVMAAVAGIEIFTRVGEEIYKAFDLGGVAARALQKATEDTGLEMRRLNTDIDVQIDKLTLEQAKLEHKPVNGMKLAIDEAAQAADELGQRIDALDSKFAKDVIGQMGGTGIEGFAKRNLTFSASGGSTQYEQTMEEQHVKWMSEAITQQQQLNEETSFGNSLQTRLNDLLAKKKEAADTAAQSTNENGTPGPSIDYSNEIAAVRLMQSHQQQETQYVQGNVDRGKLQADVDQKKADADAATKNAEAAKTAAEIQLAIMHNQHEALEANLKDEDLLTQKLKDDSEETTKRLTIANKAAEIPSSVAALNAKYFADMQKLAEQTGQKEIEEQNKVAQAIARAHIQSMPEGADKIRAQRDLQVNDNNISLTGDERGAANQAASEEMNEKLGVLSDADAKKETDRVEKISDLETQYAARAAEAQRNVKSQGIQGWLSEYKDAVVAIEAQDAAETQKLMKNALDLKMSDEEVARAKAAIDQQANAQIEAQAQELQHKLSGLMESAFKDPIGTIKSTMEKLMFDILASWITQLTLFKHLFGSTMGSITPGGGGGTSNMSNAGGIGGAVINMMHGGGHGAVVSGSSGTASVTSAQGGSGSNILSLGSGAPSAPMSVSGAPAAHASVGSDVSGGISSARNLAGMMNLGSGGSGGAPSVVASDDGTPAFLNDPTLGTSSTAWNDPSTPSVNIGGITASANATSGGLSKGLGILGAAGAGYMAEQTTVSAYDKGSMLSGTLGDAAAGATIGSVIPGIGTAIGAGIGAGIGAAVGFVSGALGAIEGMPGKLAARSYYEKTLFPEIESDRTSQDPMSAISDINRAAADGFQYMSTHFGESAAEWVRDNYLSKEIKLAITEVSQHAGGGEQYTRMNAAQFHTGGYIDGFGDLGTSSNEGYIHAMLGESINNQQATSLHAPVINAMNSGASPSDIASMYLGNARGNGGAAPQQAGDTHFHVHTLDTKTMTGWLRGGGARMITKEQNNMASKYAGDGVIG